MKKVASIETTFVFNYSRWVLREVRRHCRRDRLTEDHLTGDLPEGHLKVFHPKEVYRCRRGRLKADLLTEVHRAFRPVFLMKKTL